jgi:hypothetical protein
MTEVPCRAYVRLVQSHAAAHALTLRTVARRLDFLHHTFHHHRDNTLAHTTAPRLCAQFKIAFQAEGEAA